MYAAKRPLWRPFILVLLVVSVVLVACDGGITNTNWPGLSASGSRVYIAFGPGVYAVDVVQQELVWSFPEAFETAVQFYAAPSVLNGRVLIGDYGRPGGMFSPNPTVTLYGLQDDAAGVPPILWSSSTLANDRIIAPPHQSGDEGYFGTADNELIAVDAATGAELWRFATGHSIWGEPLYHDGIVYVASLDKSVYALQADTGQMVWQAELPGAVASQPVIDGDSVFVSSFDHKLHALELGTGRELWTYEAQNLVWGAPAVGDGLVFFGDIDGNIYAVSVNGELQWQANASYLIQSAPVYRDGVLYVASGQVTTEAEDGVLRGELFALKGADGSEVWRVPTPAPIFTAPVIVEDMIVVAPLAYSSLLIVYDMATGAQGWVFTPPAQE